MKRWSVRVAGIIACLGAAFVSGASRPADDDKQSAEEQAKAESPAGQKTGYFNMTKVMRDAQYSKAAAEWLQREGNRLSADLLKLRTEYLELRKAIQENENIATEANTSRMKELARKIEDEDRAVQKQLNARAAITISELYGRIHSAATALARNNGLSALIAYPGAATREEMADPRFKEMVLKPPAAQPFYLDPSVEFTDALIRSLNARFALETHKW